MDDPKARQAGFNAESRDHWDAFADHRRQVSALLGAGTGRTRLCVLGAGNCNDLDLPALLEVHREVDLVDLDPTALARGLARQGMADHPAVGEFGGVDVTARLDAIAGWTPRTPIGPEELAALADWPAGRVGQALPGRYDLVASTCLLTQLIGNATHALGEGHPQFLAVVQAIRTGHLRLLTHLTAPGGTAVLITDVVSSDTFPTLATLPESSLPEVLFRLARERNFFHGVNPEVLSRLVGGDPVLSARVKGQEALPPWRWNLHARLYLVWALKFRVGESRSG